jgi:hypothetical protein
LYGQITVNEDIKNMKFIEKIAAKAMDFGGSEKVKSVYIGLSYCYVMLENGDTGLAFVFKEDHLAGCNINLPKRPLAGSAASELLGFAGKSSLANSISLAVANAVLAPLVKPDAKGDFIDHFPLKPGTRVGMVGHEYELMQDKIDLLADIRTSLNQLNKGEGISHEDAHKKLLGRIDL